MKIPFDLSIGSWEKSAQSGAMVDRTIESLQYVGFSQLSLLMVFSAVLL